MQLNYGLGAPRKKSYDRMDCYWGICTSSNYYPY